MNLLFYALGFVSGLVLAFALLCATADKLFADANKWS